MQKLTVITAAIIKRESIVVFIPTILPDGARKNRTELSRRSLKSIDPFYRAGPVQYTPVDDGPLVNGA